jgi:hypothetical protein
MHEYLAHHTVSQTVVPVPATIHFSGQANEIGIGALVIELGGVLQNQLRAIARP